METLHMKTYMILFALGKDRPGIVEDISTLLFEEGANIEDSRMAVMGGYFSVMMLFSCGEDRLGAVRTGLEGLGKLGLKTSLHEAQEPSPAPPHAALPLKFEVTAIDHPGIVRKVVHILHNHDVNILALNTQVSKAPLSGAPLFSLSLEADVPAIRPISELKQDLTSLAAEMNLDLSFKR
jgi:glycine cleavage system transcriptional repressor